MLEPDILVPALDFSDTSTQVSLFLCESGDIFPIPVGQNCVSVMGSVKSNSTISSRSDAFLKPLWPSHQRPPGCPCGGFQELSS